MGWRNIEKTAYELLDKLSESDSIIIFDVETNGLKTDSKVIQFSAIRYQITSNFSLKKLDFFDVYINPESKLDKKITKITGITDNILEKCPNEQVTGVEIADYLKQSDLYAAHNASFDMNMLNNMFGRIGIEFRIEKTRVVDTLPNARDCFESDSYRLGDLIEFLGLNDGFQFHNSLDDVKATAALLSEEVKEYQRRLEQLFQEPVKRVACLNWASCSINPRAKSQQRIKVNLDDNLYGDIYWDIVKKQWDHKRTKVGRQLFEEIDLARLEEQVLSRYGKRYQATNMEELGANWLRDKKKKEKEEQNKEKQSA